MYLSELSIEFFVNLLFAVPAVAVIFGYFQKLKWLKTAVGLQAVVMVISLAAMYIEIETGRCRNCTGMEELTFLVLPGFSWLRQELALASMLSFAVLPIFGIATMSTLPDDYV